MTLTPEREEEVRKAWNERHGKARWFVESHWNYFVLSPDVVGYKMPRQFRDRMITAKGWDKERV